LRFDGRLGPTLFALGPRFCGNPGFERLLLPAVGTDGWAKGEGEEGDCRYAVDCAFTSSRAAVTILGGLPLRL